MTQSLHFFLDFSLVIVWSILWLSDFSRHKNFTQSLQEEHLLLLCGELNTTKEVLLNYRTDAMSQAEVQSFFETHYSKDLSCTVQTLRHIFNVNTYCLDQPRTPKACTQKSFRVVASQNQSSNEESTL